ncbi:UNVERIFIED_ORG: cell division protein FtsB [Xanthobacter viscosus]|uniref:Uncharacterized protein n=1 Tax=Xanthobacter autotrophicus TaxID=280 RepID=A0A6C1KKM2_XANAU|nr:hypothetical protein [Xanthobacter autotrophicus]TLX44790.1 hypothetical protein FBQ73_01710 [Xanthobacter autotrophicus]
MTIQERRDFALMRLEIAQLRAENERLRATVEPLDDAEFEALLADLAREFALKPTIRIKAPSRVQASTTIIDV